MKHKKEKIKIIDLFAGAGGLSNGFEQTGRFEVAGAVEINQAAAKTFIMNHGGNEDIIIKSNDDNSNITNINFNNVLKERELDPDNLIVIGGPPCQGFSNANRQKNYLISGNNQLIKEFVRAIQELKPKVFLLENVKTIMSDTHKFFVTEHIDNSIYALSSMEHLTEILNHKDNNKTIWNPDNIVLLETNYKEMESIIKNIFHLEDIEPIISTSSTIRRLKKIIKRAKNANIIKLDDTKEVADVKEFFYELAEKKKLLEILQNAGGGEIIKNAEKVLTDILKNVISSVTLIKYLEPFIDLNTFLFHIKELRDEKIVYDKKLDINNKAERLIVRAKVKSYNVVVYLECVFRYLNYSVTKEVLTATKFGVPQKRNRFMILGVQSNYTEGKEIKLPSGSSIFKQELTTKDAIYDLKNITPVHDLKSEPIRYTEVENPSTLQRYYRKDMKNNIIYNHMNTDSNLLSIERFKAIKKTKGKNFHSLAEELKYTYANSDRTQNTIYLRLNYDEPSPTVVNVRKSMWNHPENAVAISIREAARLQSFKDDFIFYGTKDQQYQQVGNAVPPLMARAVAEEILKFFNDQPTQCIAKEFEVLNKI